MNLDNYIQRKEISEILGVSVNTVRNMGNNGEIPVKPEQILGLTYYPRQKILDWLKTKPYCKEKRESERRKTKPFVYEKELYNTILFLQPALLNRGFEYDIPGNRRRY